MRIEQQLREEAEKAACCAKSPYAFGASGPTMNQAQDSAQQDPAYLGGGLGGTITGMASPHQLIQDRLNYHMAQIRELDALYNALPRELPYVAANALAQLLLQSRPRY